MTRRRVVQGAGSIGVVSVLGASGVVAQNETGADGDQQQAALRVAHASPDAPNVDVRLSPSTVGAGTAGNQTGGGQAGNQTGDAQTGNQTGDGDGEEETTPIEGLGFREVSNYAEVEPGTYRVEVVSAADEGFLDGLLEDLFGDEEEEEAETVLFEDEVELQAGSTHTAVAFGEVRRGPVPATDGEVEDGASVGTGNETTSGVGNETDTGVGNETGGIADNETGVGADGAAGVGPAGQPLVEGLSFGEHETVEVEAGDYTLTIQESPETGVDGETPDGVGEETPGGVDEETPDGVGDETPDGVGEETPDGVGEETSDGVGEETPEAATDGGQAGNETGVGADGDGVGGPTETGFQVAVLEDDITDPGDDMSRLRIFHAVPDVDTVSITAEPAGQGDAGNQTGGGTAGNQTGSGVGGDETPGGGVGDDETPAGAGDETPAGAGNETDAGATPDGITDGEQVQEVQISPAGNSVYSGFALGYFDPEAAGEPGDTGAADNETGLGADNETDDGLGDGNETDGGLGDDEPGAGEGNVTGDEEDVAEDPEGEEFELVTVRDAENGERTDGGTNGLFNLG